MVSSFIISLARLIGRLNRFGPALPGFTYNTPSFVSSFGLWLWPLITTLNPAAFGSISSLLRSCYASFTVESILNSAGASIIFSHTPN